MKNQIGALFAQKANNARSTYLQAVYKYATAADQSPEDVLAACEAVGKTYDDFLNDANKTIRRIEDRQLLDKVPPLKQAYQAAEAARVKAEAAHAEAGRKMIQARDTAATALREYIATQAASFEAEARLRNTALPELTEAEKPIIAAREKINARIAALEYETRINGFCSDDHPQSLANKIEGAKNRLQEWLGRYGEHHDTPEITRLKALRKRYSDEMQTIKRQLEAARKELAENDAALASITTEKLNRDT